MRTKFFTGGGDKGKTNTDKRSFSKADPIFDLLGTLDECMSWLGLCKVTAEQSNEMHVLQLGSQIEELQEYLFVAQAEIAAIAFGYEKSPKVTNEHVAKCEEMIKNVDTKLPELKNFILPGGVILAAQCDITRTVARRAERQAVLISEKVGLSEPLLAFLNRLSSVLFAFARYVNYLAQVVEKSPTYK